MNAEELTQYQYQLDQVNLALQSDPENAELLKLQTDLTELINLSTIVQSEEVLNSPSKQTKSSVPASPKNISLSATPNASTINKSTPIPTFTKPLQAGDSCLARWSDGQFYPAQITAIGGGNQVFSVIFKGYNNVEVVDVHDIKPLEKNKRSKISDKKDKEQKKRKAGDGQRKVNEQVQKQKSWLAFASGAAIAPGKKPTKTKRLTQPPINKRSIFSTPDNPEGKVGVVGSGKPMTQFQQRGKHIFDRD